MDYKYNEETGEFEDVPGVPQNPKPPSTTQTPRRAPVTSSDSLIKIIAKGIKLILSNTVIIN